MAEQKWWGRDRCWPSSQSLPSGPGGHWRFRHPLSPCSFSVTSKSRQLVVQRPSESQHPAQKQPRSLLSSAPSSLCAVRFPWSQVLCSHGHCSGWFWSPGSCRIPTQLYTCWKGRRVNVPRCSFLPDWTTSSIGLTESCIFLWVWTVYLVAQHPAFLSRSTFLRSGSPEIAPPRKEFVQGFWGFSFLGHPASTQSPSLLFMTTETTHAIQLSEKNLTTGGEGLVLLVGCSNLVQHMFANPGSWCLGVNRQLSTHCLES